MNQLDRIIYSVGYVVFTIGGGILFLMAIIKIVIYIKEKRGFK